MLESKNAWGVESLRNRARQRGRQREDKIKPAATKATVWGWGQCRGRKSGRERERGRTQDRQQHEDDQREVRREEKVKEKDPGGEEQSNGGGRTGQVGAHTAQARTLR